MTKEYIIKGMTCAGCVARVKKSLEEMEEVKSATIQLAAPQAQIEMNHSISIQKLQNTIGKYQIEEMILKEKVEPLADELPEKSWKTYQPLLLIVIFIVGVSLLVQYPFNDFLVMLWMRHFMAGFFIVFAFFKLLNLEGFASSYRMYDIVARRWKAWGYIYPFVELGLGVFYLINVVPLFVNITTIIVLGISSIGVIKSNLDKRKIKCACLGDIFNLPMSTVTIVEDVSMVMMAVGMLVYSIF